MTRREIILQILSEASGRSLEESAPLFEAMVARDVIVGCDLEEEFPEIQAGSMIEEFRRELPGIRRWLMEMGLMEDSGHA